MFGNSPIRDYVINVKNKLILITCKYRYFNSTACASDGLRSICAIGWIVIDIPDIICGLEFEDLPLDPLSKATTLAETEKSYRPLITV